MSSAEGKAEVQVSRPGYAFPFSSLSTPPHPHISQFCRFSVPERLPLKPFRQDRLTRLPLPPSVMATSKMINSTGAGPVPSQSSYGKHTGDIDPFQKIQQLEKSLVFVRESHALMLRDLHVEIADLKQKNRELQFELVTGIPTLPNDSSLNTANDCCEEQKEKMEKLEKEIGKLRNALKDTMNTNSCLTNQIRQLRRDRYSKPLSRSSGTPPKNGRSPNGPSPQMDEYSDTLRQIQRAATHRSGKHNEDWTESFARPSHNQRRHQQKSPQQPRLPRLPLRNQPNYSQQYEVQYRNTLPALKQPLVVDHRIEKPRKSRNTRPAKLADQVTNG